MPAHIERCYSLYTVEQLFDLVADVESYPQFLPWILSSCILKREQDAVWVEMILGIGPFQQRFHSQALLNRPHAIEITSYDEPFEWYRQQWRFAVDSDGRTVVEYSCNYSLRSQILELMSPLVLDEAARSTLHAFEQRAQQVYGAQERPSGAHDSSASTARSAESEYS